MVSTQTTEKSKRMFRSWLVYRPVLVFRLAFQGSKAQPKHGRAWNALLAAEYLYNLGKDSMHAAQRARRREELQKEMASFLSNNVDAGSDVQIASNIDMNMKPLWHGVPFEDLEPVHFEQMLWELSEINFRYEFQALDVRCRRGTPHEYDHNIQESLMACFPDGAFSVPSLLIANHGIASENRQERAHYLFAMARVMSKWRNVNPCGLIAKTGKLKWSPHELAALEEEIARFYTQTFHDCFRRAAVLPRRLSQPAVNACPLIGRKYVPRFDPVLDEEPTTIINSYPALYPADELFYQII